MEFSTISLPSVKIIWVVNLSIFLIMHHAMSRGTTQSILNLDQVWWWRSVVSFSCKMLEKDPPIVAEYEARHQYGYGGKEKHLYTCQELNFSHSSHFTDFAILDLESAYKLFLTFLPAKCQCRHEPSNLKSEDIIISYTSRLVIIEYRSLAEQWISEKNCLPLTWSWARSAASLRYNIKLPYQLFQAKLINFL